MKYFIYLFIYTPAAELSFLSEGEIFLFVAGFSDGDDASRELECPNGFLAFFSEAYARTFCSFE